MKLITTQEQLVYFVYKENLDDTRRINCQHNESLYIIKYAAREA